MANNKDPVNMTREEYEAWILDEEIPSVSDRGNSRCSPNPPGKGEVCPCIREAFKDGRD